MLYDDNNVVSFIEDNILSNLRNGLLTNHNNFNLSFLGFCDLQSQHFVNNISVDRVTFHNNLNLQKSLFIIRDYLRIIYM